MIIAKLFSHTAKSVPFYEKIIRKFIQKKCCHFLSLKYTKKKHINLNKINCHKNIEVMWKYSNRYKCFEYYMPDLASLTPVSHTHQTASRLLHSVVEVECLCSTRKYISSTLASLNRLLLFLFFTNNFLTIFFIFLLFSQWI